MAAPNLQIAVQTTAPPSLMAQWNGGNDMTGITLAQPSVVDGTVEWGKITVYAALLVNMTESASEIGCFLLGGRSQPKEFQLDAGGTPLTVLRSTLWGNYQWSTWCFGIGQAINEAMASNSRGPVQEVATASSVHWLILHLPIPLDKLAYLMQKQLIVTGTERNQIPSLRLYGDIEGCKVSAVDLCEQHAINVDIWGKIKLGTWKKGESRFCAECGAQGPDGSTLSTWNSYCANCWAVHLAEHR